MSMRAICLTKYGFIDNFIRTDLPTPAPKRGQVRVRVHSSAVGPADFKVAMGLVKFLHGRKCPMILGYDFSGVVDAVGEGQTRWKIGDSVFGFLPYGPGNNQGAFAEFLIAPENQVALKPASISHEQAAASATAALTALQGIRDKGKLPLVNSHVLITGVSGAVGSTGILVAKKLGAHVTAVGSQRGLELAKRHNADVVIDRKQSGIVEKANNFYDVVFDAAAAYRWSLWKTKLKAGGSFVTTLPSLAFATDKLASLFAASGAQCVFVKARDKDLELLAKWLDEGFEISIDSTLPVREVARGFLRYQNGDFAGRIVVDVVNGL
jgi:NADPH:quinone reductase-like Zn-dependent oxidoreductase